MVSAKEELAKSLSGNLIGYGMLPTEWRDFFSTFLGTQTEETLLLIDSKSVDYSHLHWKSLGTSIRNFHYGTVEIYSDPAMAYPNLANGPIPMDEFFLRVAVEMIPMLVECSATVYRSKGITGWDGEPAVPDAESLVQEVAASLDGMLDNLAADEASIRMCSGYYLNGTFGDGRLLSYADYEWISEHAVELVPVITETFMVSGFNRDHAEEVLAVSAAPLRAGVL